MSDEYPEHYILVGHTPMAVDLLTWAQSWGGDRDSRRVAYTDINDRCHVSTVFLGLNHNFWGGEPLLFETMVFGGPLDGDMNRYSTWDQAEQGHNAIVAAARIACAQVDAIANNVGAKA